MKYQEREFAADALELAPISLATHDDAKDATPQRGDFPPLNMPTAPTVNAAPAANTPPPRRTERFVPTDPEEIDLRGLQSPFPLIRAWPAIKRIQAGAQLRVAVDDNAALQDFRDLCTLHGHALQVLREDEGVHFLLTKR